MDAMEEGWIGPESLALLEEGKKACRESRDPLALSSLAIRVWDVYLVARDAHAELEGHRVQFRNQLRDGHMEVNGGTATTKADAEERAKNDPAYVAYVRQTLDAERIKDEAWGVFEVARLRASILISPAAPKPSGHRPLRSSATTQQGAAERAGEDR